MSLSLPLAFLWLAVALWNLLGPVLRPGFRPVEILGLNVGWLALAFAAYNVVRWYSRRTFLAERRRQQIEAALGARRRHGEMEPPREPDPAFDFNRPAGPEEPDLPNSRPGTGV